MFIQRWLKSLAFRRSEGPSCPRKRASSMVLEGQARETWIPAFAGMTDEEK
jgi:hypothetical protein